MSRACSRDRAAGSGFWPPAADSHVRRSSISLSQPSVVSDLSHACPQPARAGGVRHHRLWGWSLILPKTRRSSDPASGGRAGTAALITTPAATHCSRARSARRNTASRTPARPSCRADVLSVARGRAVSRRGPASSPIRPRRRSGRCARTPDPAWKGVLTVPIETLMRAGWNPSFLTVAPARAWVTTP